MGSKVVDVTAVTGHGAVVDGKSSSWVWSLVSSKEFLFYLAWNAKLFGWFVQWNNHNQDCSDYFMENIHVLEDRKWRRQAWKAREWLGGHRGDPSISVIGQQWYRWVWKETDMCHKKETNQELFKDFWTGQWIDCLMINFMFELG